MKISINWLQTYFKGKLPSPEKLSDLFTFHAFEVEGIEKINVGGVNDIVLDLKVLPDRAHYALSHKGVALEAALMTGLERQSLSVEKIAGSIPAPKVVVHSDFCRRYMARRIENIKVSDSPKDRASLLQAIGQRSINAIVDATNIVMFDVGQPLHAFDADKIDGAITVRETEANEKIMLLDGKEIDLAPKTLVIADDAGPLAIAGVKGGKRAEVNAQTKNIIIESANFDPVRVRRTSTLIGIRNESSKRFENNLSPEAAEEGMDYISAIIQKLCPEAVFGAVVDIYNEKPKQIKLSVNPKEINIRLGVEVPVETMVAILSKMEIVVEKKGAMLDLTIPLYRQDITQFEDVVEEIGRIYGYDKVPAVLPPKVSLPLAIHKGFYYSEKIKTALAGAGFSEVYLYTFVLKGDLEVTYPLASDKKALRTDLAKGMEDALIRNSRNADLLELDQIKLFEIGTIFPGGKEQVSFALGAAQVKKTKGLKAEDILDAALAVIEKELEITFDKKYTSTQAGAIFETSFDDLLEKLPEPTTFDLDFGALPEIVYKPFSVYPFITRDIAVFVPGDMSGREIHQMIREKVGSLLVRSRLFDTFAKQMPDGTTKTSFAYRLVFQSSEKTLTDEEVNAIMDGIYKLLGAKGFEIR